MFWGSGLCFLFHIIEVLMLELLLLGGGGNNFPCDRCGCSYKHYRNLQRHQKYECGIEPQFECPECHVKMKDKSNLYKHARTKHGLELCKKYLDPNYSLVY